MNDLSRHTDSANSTLVTRAKLEAASESAHKCLLAVYDAGYTFIMWTGNLQQGAWNGKISRGIMRKSRMDRHGVVDETELNEAINEVREHHLSRAMDESEFGTKVSGMMARLEGLKTEFERTYTTAIDTHIVTSLPNDARPFGVSSRTATTAHAAAGMAIGHFLYIIRSSDIKPKLKDFIDSAIDGILAQRIDYDGLHANIDLEFSRASAQSRSDVAVVSEADSITLNEDAKILSIGTYSAELTQAQFEVVRVLLAVSPNRMTIGILRKKSGKEDAPKILAGLKKNTQLSSRIHMPGRQKGTGYAIA